MFVKFKQRCSYGGILTSRKIMELVVHYTIDRFLLSSFVEVLWRIYVVKINLRYDINSDTILLTYRVIKINLSKYQAISVIDVIGK